MKEDVADESTPLESGKLLDKPTLGVLWVVKEVTERLVDERLDSSSIKDENVAKSFEEDGME